MDVSILLSTCRSNMKDICKNIKQCYSSNLFFTVLEKCNGVLKPKHLKTVDLSFNIRYVDLNTVTKFVEEQSLPILLFLKK